MPKESWECGTWSTVCSHRWCSFYQMVHLHVWMKVRSTNQTRSQEHAGETTWPDVRSVSCSFVRRGADTTLSESQKKGEESALLCTLLVFMFTPWPRRGGRRSRRLGPALVAPWRSIPIFEGTEELFMPLQLESFLKSSSKIAETYQNRERRQ